jgi:NADPH:quinone reductase-like Zn-dependent oxidoreductase
MTMTGEKMNALRLHAPGGTSALRLDRVDVPEPDPGEAVVRVKAAAITRDELDWPVDRLPAIPSYELSGTVAMVGEGVTDLVPGDEVWALTAFDRDGVAAEYALVTAELLAPKPTTTSHIVAGATPLPALSAWQGLFDHGDLRQGDRVLITGATGGVGQFATQLAAWRGAYVIGATSSDAGDVLALGAAEAAESGITAVGPVDLVFDTVGRDALAWSGAFVRDGGRIVSVAEEPPGELRERSRAAYFVVEPNRTQLIEIARLVDEAALTPRVDSVFPLAEATKAFARVAQPGKRGKVVLGVGPNGAP